MLTYINNMLKNNVLFYLLLMIFGIAGCLNVSKSSKDNLTTEEIAVTEIKKASSCQKTLGSKSCCGTLCKREPVTKIKHSNPESCWKNSKSSKNDNVFILAMGSDTDCLECTNYDTKKFALENQLTLLLYKEKYNKIKKAK